MNHFRALLEWHAKCSFRLRVTEERQLNLTTAAINQFILHEIVALRTQEQRLNNALSRAAHTSDRTASTRFIRSIQAMENRIEDLDSILENLRPDPSQVHSRDFAAA